MARNITIALAGNPNCGKTTIFNNLTGARQHVGNWPGVTVERKEGVCRYGDYEILVVDLPGTYSLTAYSLDEIIARNFVLQEKPDVVVNIVDASNLERNLYLTTQFMEMEIPLMVCLNMMDLAESRGFKIDVKRIAESLGVPVISTVGRHNQGTANLLNCVLQVVANPNQSQPKKIRYGLEVEREITKLETLIRQDEDLSRSYPPRWLAIKILEGDEGILRGLGK